MKRRVEIMWIWICRTHLNWLRWMSCSRKIVHLHVMWTGFEGALEFICILFSFRIPFITVQSHSVQHSISGPIQTMVEFLVASCYSIQEQYLMPNTSFWWLSAVNGCVSYSIFQSSVACHLHHHHHHQFRYVLTAHWIRHPKTIQSIAS